MKKNKTPELITLEITALSHDGRGIGNANGKTIFVSGAIEGETVICKVNKKYSRYNEGEATEILKASPMRTTPSCHHFNICGGCSMQHIDAKAQIQLKQKTLLEQLNHFGKVTPEIILPPLFADPWGYRRKARLGVRYVKKKERLMVGFREKFSNFLADIRTCSVLQPEIGTRIELLGELIASLTQFDHIAQIEVAATDKEAALIFRHLTDLPTADIEKLIAFGQTHSLQIYLQPNPPQLLQKIWPKDQNHRLSYRLDDYQLEMQFHPLDFIQVNGKVNLLMLKQALHLLDLQPTDNVLDLFCGLGNFTFPMARTAQQVTGIEGSKEMVERAQENARHNNINNTEFYACNLMEPVSSLPWIKKKYDKILLDPPRTGAKEIIEFFPQFNAKRIVYVSCNPATLARDAGELVHTHGYQLKQVGVVDMFPHTSHIEAIALFEK